MQQFVAPSQLIDDATVIGRIAAGDSQALAWLYRRDGARVMRYCLAIAHDESLASDALQDTFVSLAAMAHSDKPSGFDADKGSLLGYLLGIARHHLLKALRDAGRYVGQSANADDDFEPATEAHHALNPMLHEVARQSTQALMAAIAALPFVFREAVVLVDLQEFSYEDAANLAGVPLNTLRTRVHRGRNRLARALCPEPEVGVSKGTPTHPSGTCDAPDRNGLQP